MVSAPTTSAEGTIKTDAADGVIRIQFGHPKANALPLSLLTGLAAAIDAAGRRPDARVVLLESAGTKSFCAGASFDELDAIKSLEASNAFFGGFAAVLLAMRTCPLLIVARVQGKAVGGGVGLLAAADYVIALESAAVRLSEFAFDFGPFTVAPAIERKIGVAHLAALTMDSEWRDSAWCLRTGLFSRTCVSLEQLDTEVSALAQTLAGRSAEASRELKAMLWTGIGEWSDLLAERARVSGRLWFAKTEKAGNR